MTLYVTSHSRRGGADQSIAVLLALTSRGLTVSMPRRVFSRRIEGSAVWAIAMTALPGSQDVLCTQAVAVEFPIPNRAFDHGARDAIVAGEHGGAAKGD